MCCGTRGTGLGINVKREEIMVIDYKDVLRRKNKEIEKTKDKNLLDKLFTQIDKLLEWKDIEIRNKCQVKEG
jgi:hypothetical protein